MRLIGVGQGKMVGIIAAHLASKRFRLQFHTKMPTYDRIYVYTYVYMGGCLNYGPLLGTVNIRCRIMIGTPKGTIILTTTHIYTPRKIREKRRAGGNVGLRSGGLQGLLGLTGNPLIVGVPFFLLFRFNKETPI